jgi:hypothetical protein
MKISLSFRHLYAMFLSCAMRSVSSTSPACTFCSIVGNSLIWIISRAASNTITREVMRGISYFLQVISWRNPSLLTMNFTLYGTCGYFQGCYKFFFIIPQNFAKSIWSGDMGIHLAWIVWHNLCRRIVGFESIHVELNIMAREYHTIFIFCRSRSP